MLRWTEGVLEGAGRRGEKGRGNWYGWAGKDREGEGEECVLLRERAKVRGRRVG